MANNNDKDSSIMADFLKKAAKNRLKSAQRDFRKKRAQPDTRPKAAIVFGAGSPNGIGAAVARRIATGGLRVYVTGRTAEKIAKSVTEIEQAGGQAIPITVDVGKPEHINSAFAQIAKDGYALDLVVFNVGTNSLTGFLDITAEQLETSWRNDCLAGFLVGQQALEAMLPQGRGSIIFTGASASLRGKAYFASFAQAKSGLRLIAQAMAREFGPQGIHVAHVIIDGLVDGERLNSMLPELIKQQGEDGAMQPAAIAENYWQIYQQDRSAWTHEIDLRPFRESW